MNIPFTVALFQIPSVQRFLNTLADELANRRSLLVLLPVGVDPAEVWSTLRTELCRRDFWFEEVSLRNLTENHAPIAAVSKALNVHWPTPDTSRTIANLMAAGDLPDVVQLEDLDRLPDTACRDWLNFLTQWAQSSQGVADRGCTPTALCMIVPAVAVLPQVPESGVHLGIHWWWGFPSALEIHLLCRLDGESDDWDASARWREHLLPALAGSDVSLAEYLWDDLHLDVEHLVRRLNAFAQQQGWETRTLQTWGSEEIAAVSSHDQRHHMLSPPAQWRTLWAHGALNWTLEYGLELHTAALAALGRDEELRHRVWRGQAELLLPLIDQMRLTVCDDLTHSYGRDWPVRWNRPASPEEDAAVRNSPLACQWGYLEWLLKNCAHLRSERRWIPLVSLARWIRNEMAHYRPVTFRDFEGFWYEVERAAAH